MSLAGIETRTLPVEQVRERHQFSRIKQDGPDAVLWGRAVSERVQDWLDHLNSNDWPEERIVLKAEDVRSCLIQLFNETACAADPNLAWLIDDITSLADQLSTILDCADIRMRIEWVVDDACRKFHVDNVQARLICTYSGPGTEYITSADISRQDHIHCVPTGQPMLFKGKQWPGKQEVQLKHRSPPISGTGRRRLVVVLEPASIDPEDLHPSDIIFTYKSD